MPKILDVQAREILDSRGNPTVEVDLLLEENAVGRAAVPSGASTGAYEALELRDGDKSRFLGKGVTKAIANIEGEIKDAIVGKDLTQQELDDLLIELDGTENKDRLGANAILGVSLAHAWAMADYNELHLYEYIAEITESEPSLPRPMFNIMNGGKHADWSTDVQEFMVIIENRDYMAQLRAGAEIFGHLGKLIKAEGMNTNIGNEGGYAPGFANNEEAFTFISKAVENAGYKLGEDVFFALDVASTEFYDEEKGVYVLKTEDKELTPEEWMQRLEEWMEKYPIISLEDGFAEDDWENWSKFTEKFGDKLQIVGDDLLVTNTKRISRAIDEKSCNSLLVKVNQIGTLSEALAAMKAATDAGWTNVVSHRSGETEDVTISHIATGTGAGQIKTGAPSRGERTAKYNELIRIAESL